MKSLHRCAGAATITKQQPLFGSELRLGYDLRLMAKLNTDHEVVATLWFNNEGFTQLAADRIIQNLSILADMIATDPEEDVWNHKIG